MEDLTRQELIRIVFDESFKDDEYEILWTPRKFHEDLLAKLLASGNPEAYTIYHPRGLIPPILNVEDEVMNIGIAPEIIDAQTAELPEDLLISYCLYWVTRMRLRIVKEFEMEQLQDATLTDRDDVFLEELVESEMRFVGLEPWWSDRLVE